MRDDDGRKLDHATLELLRMRAVQAVEAGRHPEEVAAAMGMARGTVFMWLAKYREGGLDALRARPVPGKPPKLDTSQTQRLLTLIVGADPRHRQLEFALWTRDLVRQVILAEFGINLSVVSVGRLLRKLGLCPQRPLLRVWQAAPEAMARWHAEEYPAIRAAAKREGATVHFAHETGIRLDHGAGNARSPAGVPPAVKVTGARDGVTMLSAVTARGAFRFTVARGMVDAAMFVDFCTRLLDDAGVRGGRPVYLIADGHPAHTAEVTRDFVASTGGGMRLFILPARSPRPRP